MLVSHAHRLVYMKTRKTAGTSVEVYLEHACLGSAEPPLRSQREEREDPALIVGRRSSDISGARWWNHIPAALVRERLGPLWDAYLKVCCVRNPFDKLVSAFWMQQPDAARAALAEASFEQVRQAFRAWALGGGDLMGDREVVAIDGAFCLDEVIRYETLARDLERVCDLAGLPWRPELLKAYKSANRRRPEPFAAYYDAATIALVRDAFAFELGQFGYPDRPDANTA